MDRTFIGIAFVVFAVAVVIWRGFQHARTIADAPDRAPMPPESPALAVSRGVGDYRKGLNTDDGTAEDGGDGFPRAADQSPF